MFEPEQLIRETIKRYGDNVAVACSFGKASTIVMDIALKVNPNIKIVFNNTLVQFKETYDYRDLWKPNINLHETKPEKTFWECADLYGLPKPRKSGGKGANSPRCCYYLKEKPADIKYKELGTIAVITGIMAKENRNRKLLIARYDNMSIWHQGIKLCGQRYYAKTENRWKLHPLAYWNDDDLDRYYKLNCLPINQAYTKWGGIYKRTGCLCCTAYLSWKQRLSKSHPKLLKKLLLMQGQKQLKVRY